MIEEKYPEVNYVYNDRNLGFGKANNMGLKLAKGEFIFLLNPDTLIEEDTIDLCLKKMKSDDQIGALGSKLQDGNGNYLAESKRGFPTLSNALFKLVGLSSLFPQSSLFSSYNKGDLSKDEVAEVDVLCGAMMFVRTDLMKELQGFDEDYFMYGEDIDLCYRIKQKGSKIIYFPETSIIHYKGESSKRNKYSYYKMFYEAMMIYVRKHFKSGGSALAMQSFLKTAIVVRGGIGFGIEAIKKLIHPLVDLFMMIGVFKIVSQLWAIYFFGNEQYYSNADVWLNILVYSSIWVLSLWMLGNYDKKTSLKNLLFGFSFGFILNLIIYALLPLEFRFSRANLLIGSGIVFFLLVATKYLFNYLSLKRMSLQKPLKKQIVIVGEKSEIYEIESLLENSRINHTIKGYVNSHDGNDDPFFLNSIDKLSELLKIIPVNEIIFSAKSVSYKSILSWMSKLDSNISIKIAGRSMFNIIGSDSSNETGELYTIDVQYKIKEAVHKRLKRFGDIVLSLIAFVFSPLRFIFTGFDFSVFTQIFQVLFNQKTWVGYHSHKGEDKMLPKIKPGIFSVISLLGREVMSNKEVGNINNYYARNYSVLQDVEVFARSIFKNKKSTVD